MSHQNAPTETSSATASEIASATQVTRSVQQTTATTKSPSFIDYCRAETAASAMAGARSNAGTQVRSALPLHSAENPNLTMINAQQLCDLRFEAVSTARDNSEIAHENHVLRGQLREARTVGRAYYDAAQDFAALERDWIAERRSLLARLDRYGALTEDEEVELFAGAASTRQEHDQAVAAAEAQGLMVRTPEYVAAHGVGLTAAAVVAGVLVNAVAAGGNSVNGRTAGFAGAGNSVINDTGARACVNGDCEVRREENARLQLD
ncbi:hypothetical protein H2200_002039 [Cladophialophora chaetospira]|uniref:Uncharacterized protein n=1 Tax=Cladophialophora chaetospira TaxID=386627 RepID=A0AA38XIB9_9EURO|nr:hypothetical protein H2200_002039 [Cladophialophora chaetospira]